MPSYDPQTHHRHSIRLAGYDYTRPGAYFVTVVTRGRECLFGGIVDGEMRLNDYGIEFDYSFCVHLLTNKNICASIRA